MEKKNKIISVLLVMSAFMTVALCSVRAATVVWTAGGGNADWSTSGNWSAVPTSADRAAIAAASAYGSVDATITQSGEVAGSLDIGKGTAGLTGTVTMASGSLNVSSPTAGHFEIGGVGTGVFTQSGGTVSVALNVILGSASGSGSGAYNLSGTGVLNATHLNVGYLSTGGFNHNLGGSSTINTTGGLYVGYNPGVVGDYNMSTGSTANFDSGAIIGYLGTGLFNQSGGAFNSKGDIYIGFGSEANGTCTLTGGTLTMNKTSGRLVVGKAGSGTLHLGYTSNATTITETATSTTDLYVGYDSGSTGLLEGWGMVDLSGNLFNNGQIIANGYDNERTLDLSGMTRLFNQHSGTINGNGLYAKRGGRLLLPPITVATDTKNYTWGDNLYDSTPHMVNATKISVTNDVSGYYTVELLAADRTDVPVSLKADARLIGVWKYSTFFDAPGAGTAVTMRYDDALASALGISESELKLYQHVDGMWKDVTCAVNTQYHLITGVTDSLSTFAVGVGLEGISLGWYSLSSYYSFNPTYTAGLTDAQRIARWRAPLVEAANEGWDYVMMYGLNDYSFTVNGTVYDMAAFMDEAQALGVKVLVTLASGGGVPSDTDITTMVNTLKNHPALYGYYLIDEPEMREGAPYYVTAADCVHAYRLAKSLDPRHLVHITMSDSIMNHSEYLAAADVIAKELYNSDHWAEIEDDIVTVKNAGKPFVIVPRIYLGQGLYALTLPSAEEFQYNIVAPLVMGALYANGGGILPFIFQGYQGWQVDPPTSATVREDLCYPTTRVLQTITPYLIKGNHTGCTFQWVHPSGVRDARFKRLILGDSTDDVILIIINDFDGSSTESFKVNGLDPSITTADRLDSSHMVTLDAEGTIQNQSFSAYEVKVYRFRDNALNPISGDANGDGKVDVGDLGILAANYGTVTGAIWSMGDFNNDGAVDVGDLGILAANYGEGASSSANFNGDYARVFGTTVADENKDDSVLPSSGCSTLGLSLIAGILLLGLFMSRLKSNGR